MKTSLLVSVCILFCLSSVYTQQSINGEPDTAQADSIQKIEKVSFIVEDTAETQMKTVLPSDPSILYSGRIDFSKSDTPVFIWQGSGFSCTFYGPVFGITLSSSGLNSYYNILIDGKVYLLHLSNIGKTTYILESDLGEGLHSCTVFKRVEAMFAQDKFHGLILDKNSALGQRPEEKKLLIEFYGDSITAGACNEDPDEDSYTNYIEHNNYTSYGAIACRLLDADYSNIAVSGTGICASWNDILLSKNWKNLYPRNRSPQADFSKRQPDIVILNLGQNDYGYPQSRGEPFPADFQEKYEALLREMRSVYPDAWIICATGGMSAVKSSRQLISGINTSIKNMNDSKTASYFFKAFTYNHPRVDTHEKMAEELVHFLIEKGIVQ